MTEALIEADTDPKIDHEYPMPAAVIFKAINVARPLPEYGRT